MMIPLLQTATLILMIVSAIIALNVRDLLAAVVSLGLFSFLAAILYALLKAPDVALIEAVAGVVITVFFAVTIYRIGRGTSL